MRESRENKHRKFQKCHTACLQAASYRIPTPESRLQCVHAVSTAAGWKQRPYFYNDFMNVSVYLVAHLLTLRQ